MDYDILKKATKEELIEWMRRNVRLPLLSDEDFLQDIKLHRHMKRREELMRQDEALTPQLEAASKEGRQIEFMRLMMESDKLNEEIRDLDKKISKLLGVD